MPPNVMESCMPTRPDPQPKIWKCGDRDQFSIPKPNGNPWKTCLEPLLEEDRLNCEAWKDEVQNLLLFAGLFSAVVTAFVIQSYQYLQPDQNSNANALLALVLTHISNPSESPTHSQPSLTQTRRDVFDTPFYPSASSIRVNIYWFLSLILSLMTVLIGIICLQWIREYQRYPSNVPPKRTFAARNMRSEAFEQWFVPQILAGLPLFLQAALVLFFVGLIDFLLHLNPYVAVPAIVMIASTILFLLVTTFLPSIQAFYMLNLSNTSSIPVQCPYKSPQSWAFLCLASSWIFRFALNGIGNVIANCLMVPLFPVVFLMESLDKDNYVWKFLSYLQVSFKLKYLGTLRSWNEFDGFWLDERHRLYTNSSAPCTYFTKMIGNIDCDAARGIAHVVDGYAREESIAVSAYHCFQQLPPSVIKDDIFQLMSKSLPGWMTSRQATRKSPMLEHPSHDMTREENEMFLLGRLPQTSITNPIHIFRKRQLELFIRTNAYIFANDPWVDNPEVNYDLTVPKHSLKKRSSPGKLLIPVCLKTVKGVISLPEPLSTELQEQIVGVFKRFVNGSLEGVNEEHVSLEFRHTEEILGNFMELLHIISLSVLKSAPNSRSCSNDHAPPALDTLVTTITQLSRNINQERPTLDMAYYISIMYASRFHYTEWASICRRSSGFSAALRNLIQSLQRHETAEGWTNFQFTVHDRYYGKQWEDLKKEVLADNREMLSTEDTSRNASNTNQLDIIVDIPSSDLNLQENILAEKDPHQQKCIFGTPLAQTGTHISDNTAPSPDEYQTAKFPVAGFWSSPSSLENGAENHRIGLLGTSRYIPPRFPSPVKLRS